MRAGNPVPTSRDLSPREGSTTTEAILINFRVRRVGDPETSHAAFYYPTTVQVKELNYRPVTGKGSA